MGEWTEVDEAAIWVAAQMVETHPTLSSDRLAKAAYAIASCRHAEFEELAEEPMVYNDAGKRIGVFQEKPKGLRGVHWNKVQQRWVGVVVIDGKQKRTGSFYNMKDAVASREPYIKQMIKDACKPEQKHKYTYLMIDRRNGYYKIGISSNPRVRESTLQSEVPQIELLCSGAQHSPLPEYSGRQLETELHCLFKDVRIRGEWFDLTLAQVDQVIRAIKSGIVKYT